MSATLFDKCGARLRIVSDSIILSVEHPLLADTCGHAELEPREAVELAYALLTAAGDKAAPIPLKPENDGEVRFVALDANGYRVYGSAGTVAHARIELDVQLPSGSWMPVSRLHKGDRWRFRIQGKE